MRFKNKGQIVILLSIIIVSYYSLSFMDSNNYQQKRKKNQPSDTLVFSTNVNGKGVSIEIDFEKGARHNHPMMAIWVEDTTGKYIQTLFVNKSMATSTFTHGGVSEGKWMPGMIRRPAALPYWSHKRGIQAADGLYLPTPDNPVPDAYTGATPPGNFILHTQTDESLSGKVNILLEINQSWDWNNFWTNDKFPDETEYKTSSQPSLVYSVTVDFSDIGADYIMKPIGHGHYSGKDGDLYTDLCSMTTALDIVESIIVKVK
jgi:hypothetical protein